MPGLDATQGNPAPLCSIEVLQLVNWGIPQRSSAGTWPSNGEFGMKLAGCSKNEGHWGRCIDSEEMEGLE